MRYQAHRYLSAIFRSSTFLQRNLQSEEVHFDRIAEQKLNPNAVDKMTSDGNLLFRRSSLKYPYPFIGYVSPPPGFLFRVKQLLSRLERNLYFLVTTS